MAKTALLIEMIALLRSRPGVSVPELATSLDRSERTIYRWLSELSSEIGAPVYFRDGGYYLSDREEPDELRLSAEELVALRIGLRSPLFSEGSPLRQEAESAWRKIRDASDHDRIETARETLCSYSARPTTLKGFLRSGVTETIESAISSHHRLRVVYRSQKSNRVKTYVIEPYALVFRRHSWYLLANSDEHGKVVQFKLVRFRECADTGETFEPNADFSIEDYFRLSWEAWAGGDPTHVRVRFSPKVAVMVAEAKRHSTQRVHPQADGGIIFEATVAGIEEIAIWIMGFGKDAEALEPPELRELVRDHVAGMARMYSEEPQLDSEHVLACIASPTCTDPSASTI